MTESSICDRGGCGVVVEGGMGWRNSSGVDLVVSSRGWHGSRRGGHDRHREVGSSTRLDLADSALRGLAGRDLTDGVLRPRIDPVLAMLVAENPSGVGGAEGGGAEERDREWGGGSVGSDVVGMQLPWDCAMGEGLLQNVAGDASVVGAPTVARASAFWGCNMVCTYC
jgi:hypothetical protein